MPTIEVILLSLALAADATAVCIAWSLCRPGEWRRGLALPIAFGAAQAGMAALGAGAGLLAVGLLSDAMGIVAVLVLAALGVNLLRPKAAADEECEAPVVASPSLATVCVLAIATSVDALAAGVTLHTFTDQTAAAIAAIGVLTFVLALFGLRLGASLGRRAGALGEKLGGIVLLGLAVKTGLELALQ